MSRECITFTVCGQLFALDFGLIHEILSGSPVTRVPGLPPYVAGVINLRGTLLPVVDLAARLGWEPTVCTRSHALLIVRIKGGRCGLLVESVGDLAVITQASLQPPPALDTSATPRLVEGLAPLRDRVVQLLHIEALAEGDMMTSLGSA